MNILDHRYYIYKNCFNVRVVSIKCSLVHACIIIYSISSFLVHQYLIHVSSTLNLHNKIRIKLQNIEYVYLNSICTRTVFLSMFLFLSTLKVASFLGISVSENCDNGTSIRLSIAIY